MSGEQGGLMWALIFITIPLRFSPNRLENFMSNKPIRLIGSYEATFTEEHTFNSTFTLI
jgi:hypothetical protein